MRNLEFNTDANLILSPAPNGGWTVLSEGSQLGERETLIGAFSDTEAMLDALTQALIPAVRAFNPDCNFCEGTGSVSANEVGHFETPCPKCSVKL